MTGNGLAFRHCAADEVTAAIDVVVALYKATHADLIESDPFMSVGRFLDRLNGYQRAPGFELVLAYRGAQPAGIAFGYTLPRDARWWDGLITPVTPGQVEETGARTFAVNEIMVHPVYQRQGVARALHAELMAGRDEERATLLVRQDNESAQAAYARWGYTSIGQLQPFPDAPLYDALVLQLV